MCSSSAAATSFLKKNLNGCFIEWSRRCCLSGGVASGEGVDGGEEVGVAVGCKQRSFSEI